MALFKTKVAPKIDDAIACKIKQRRYQMLVHSYLYYDRGTAIVSDETWQKWANELIQLNKDYPELAKQGPFAKDFETFDGTTGFDLPYRLPEIISKGERLIDYERRIGK